ncbi:MAG: helix-hairpin-helix domain-containing protein [Thermoleophilaceae bacterium]|nr:helix-hairpin-helix domain-containing protein [Thermoleophilaceae bacterium]
MSERSRGTVVAWVVAAVLATIAVLRLLGGGDDAASPSVRLDGPRSANGAGIGVGDAGAGSGSAAAGRSRAAGEGVYVHVAGAVRRPGLFRVPAGSRVAAAVARAGGPVPKADLTLVNLAARVQDGQQVVVPGPGVAAPAAAGGETAAGGALPGVKPSLATATRGQLEELDGIGETLAERIIEYRDAHGGFRSLDELREVEGIGEKRFESLREALQP